MGIGPFNRLSVSNVNGFALRRPQWYAQRVKGYEFIMPPGVYAGRAFERGVVNIALERLSIEDSISLALDEYRADAEMLDVDLYELWVDDLPRAIEAGAEALAELKAKHGKIVGIQQRHVWEFPEMPGVEWVGYEDIVFEDGLGVDTKLTRKVPSELKSDWGWQGAAYSFARKGAPVSFLVVSPQKTKIRVEVMPLENASQHLAQLIQYAKHMEQFFQLSEEAQALACLPDPDHYVMNDGTMQLAAKKIWNTGKEIQHGNASAA